MYAVGGCEFGRYQRARKIETHISVSTGNKLCHFPKCMTTASLLQLFPSLALLICVPAFGKAVHALARLGDQLWLDPMDKGLALRSVNSARSAYSCFLFSPCFFISTACLQPQARASILPLFRLPSIERTVERFQVSIEDDLVKMKFFANTMALCSNSLMCVLGIVKTHNLRFQESDALQAVFASHLCPNVLKAPAKLLSDMVMHFPVSQEEITLSLSSGKVSLRNYFEGGHDHMKTMHTEMSLHPDEFDYFQVGVESDITFCLKELRGLLSFAESHCLPVSVYFGAAGKPVCFCVEDMVLEATVVLATLMESESRAASQHTTTTPLQTTRPEIYYLSLRPGVRDNWATAGHGSVTVSNPLIRLCSHCPRGYRALTSQSANVSRPSANVNDEYASFQNSSPHSWDDKTALKHEQVCCGGCRNTPASGHFSRSRAGRFESGQSHPRPCPAPAHPLSERPAMWTREPNLICAPAPSPAPSMVCSLLFKALSSQSEDDSGPSPNVLVCASDEEEEMEQE
ncbi:hypothetical protein WMY93_004144 [Mugilogobius chulae]|uniref:Cell cycle checkpoint control protein RAD9A n=1 Tax=Mugilogobius chulae TaxID=88201 RepID=A0AAW0PQB2_9GOBI